MVELADILGCWQLKEALEIRDGVLRNNPNFGVNPTGFLHYLPDWRVSVITANGGRSLMSGTTRRNAPIEELAESQCTFDAYAGRFSFVEPDKIAHHLEICSYENDVGKDYVRTVRIENDELHLILPVSHENGQEVLRFVVWKRLTKFRYRVVDPTPG